jgi:hypothetical protein
VVKKYFTHYFRRSPVISRPVVYHNSIYNAHRLPASLDTNMLPDLRLNDHLRLRKQHPCGSYEWTVTRLGADIGLECRGCGRRVMLTRRELARRLKVNLTQRQEEQSREQKNDS